MSDLGGVPQFAYSNARDAAYQILEAAKAVKADELHPLPFNRYDPDDTFWWLSPSSENPAYRFGKIGIAGREIVRPGELFVGLVVEKGIGESAAPMFADTAKGRRWIMDDTWRWSRRLWPALFSDELPGAAARAAETAGLPLEIIVDAAYMTSPSQIPGDNPRDSGIAFDLVRMRYADGGLTCTEAKTPSNLLTPLTTTDSFFGLGAALESIPKLDWVWVDFHIGVCFGSIDDTESDVWTPTDVWRKACAPWLGWVR